VALDERGDNLDSAAFAGILAAGGTIRSPTLFLQLAARDGLSPDLRRKAKLGRCVRLCTWPHQMVRRHASGTDLSGPTILSGILTTAG